MHIVSGRFWLISEREKNREYVTEFAHQLILSGSRVNILKPTYMFNLFLTLFFLRYKLILEMLLNPLSSDHHAQKWTSSDTRQFTRCNLFHIVDDSLKLCFRSNFRNFFFLLLLWLSSAGLIWRLFLFRF